MAEEVDARQAVMSTCLEASSTPRDMSPAREGLRKVGDSGRDLEWAKCVLCSRMNAFGAVLSPRDSGWRLCPEALAKGRFGWEG